MEHVASFPELDEQLRDSYEQFHAAQNRAIEAVRSGDGTLVRQAMDDLRRARALLAEQGIRARIRIAHVQPKDVERP